MREILANTNNLNEILSILKNGEDYIFQDVETKISISTTLNQEKNKNKNVTTINLGDCEKKLKYEYNISENESLYLITVEVKKEGMQISKLEYEVYYPLDSYNSTKLNLSICRNIPVSISNPVAIDENKLELYDPNSDYYNDICYSHCSDNGYDISLADRKNIFVNINLTLCEENCKFVGYNFDTKKASCSCEVKINLPLISEIYIDKNKLYESFTDFKNIANINIMKCINLLFSIKIIKNNYGIFIIIALIIIQLISCIIFFCCGKFEIIIQRIKLIKSAKIKMKKHNKKYKKHKKKELIKKSNIKKHRKVKNKNSENKIPSVIRINSPIIIQNAEIQLNLNKNSNENTGKKLKNDFSYTNKNKNSKKNREKSIKKINCNLECNMATMNKNKKIKIKKIKLYKDILQNNIYELNELNYKEAIRKDKRGYWGYYISLLKLKHLFIFAFILSNDDNSKIIKISFFFFSFALHITVSAFFFNDKTMHKIYEDQGSFNFIYQIPQIIYSSLISMFFSSIIKMLALSYKNILQLKKGKNNKKLKQKEKYIINLLKFKFILYYVLSTLLLLVFGYYIGCFCAVYKNTQKHLLKDTIISFILNMVYPFGICLLPGIFRITSLNARKKDKNVMYNFSKIIQFI